MGNKRDLAESIGIIGAGAMCAAVLSNLMRHGYRVLASDIRPEAEQAARAAGAEVVASAGEVVARCAVTISLVRDAAETEAVLFGSQGAAAVLSGDRILLLSSTLAPSFVAGLGERLPGRKLLDAPVSGGPKRALAGTMSMMLAGEAATVARVEPLLNQLAGKVFHLGQRLGLASTYKLLNNMAAAANLAAASEAIALGCRLGLQPRVLAEVIAASSGASWVLADRLPRMEAPREVHAAIDVLKKDLGLFRQLAAESQFDAPIGAAVHASFTAASAAGFGGEDDAALVDWLLARQPH